MRQTTLTYSPSDRERFRQGTLWKQWARGIRARSTRLTCAWWRQWFFTEVKGPRDTLSLGQLEFFREIERRSGGKDIELVRAVCV